MATTIGSSYVEGSSPSERGRQAAREARSHLGDAAPVLAVAFLSEGPEMGEVLAALGEELGDVPLVGCSSSGEFTESACGLGGVSLTLVASDRMEVRVGVGEDYAADVRAAVQRATAGFAATSGEVVRPGWRGRTLMLFVDGLAGRAEELVDELGAATGLQYQLFGGAAADQVRFEKTSVFHGDRMLSGAFVCVEVLSEKPFGIGMSHGRKPVSQPLRVTRASGSVVQEINGVPAREFYQDYAREFGIPTDDETVFLMSNIIGIEDGSDHKLRVPLAVVEEGGIACSAEVPEGAVVRIMQSDIEDVLACAQEALEAAAGEDDPIEYAGALLIGCVATRLQLGERFAEAVAAASHQLEPNRMGGCAAYGQLARIGTSFAGRQSATSVVCLIPR